MRVNRRLLRILILFSVIMVSGCARPVPATPVQAFSRSVDWSTPTSRTADRLLLAGDPPVYRAVWSSPKGPQLVVMIEGPDLAGKVWHVEVFNADGELVRSGTVRSPEGVAPYSIMEFRSDDPSLPESYRGDWMLAIGFCGPHFDSRRRPNVTHERIPSDDDANVVFVNAVRWPDDSLRNATLSDFRVRLRSAERPTPSTRNAADRPRWKQRRLSRR